MKTAPPVANVLVAILGASKFPRSDFEKNAAFEAAASAMRDFFVDPDGFNLHGDNYIWLFDYPLDPSATLDRLATFIAERATILRGDGVQVSDLIIYYVGHGGFDEDNAFFLAIHDTNRNNKSVSSIRISALGTTISTAATWLRTTLIFDACFSAAAASALQSGITQAMARKIDDAPFPPKGVALLAAASKSRTTQVTPEGDITMFTKALLAVLRHGDPSIAQDKLQLDEVHELVSDKARQLFGPGTIVPELHSPRQMEGLVAKVPLYPNRAVIRAREIAQEEAERERKKRDQEVRTRAANEKVSREQRQAEESRRQEIERAEKARQETEANQRAALKAQLTARQPQNHLDTYIAETEKAWDRELANALVDRWLETKIDDLEHSSLRVGQETEDTQEQLGERLRRVRNLSVNIPVERRKGYPRSVLQPLYDDLRKYREEASTLANRLRRLKLERATIDAQQSTYRSALSGALRDKIMAELRVARQEGRTLSFASILLKHAERAVGGARRTVRRERVIQECGRFIVFACGGLSLLIAAYLLVVEIPWAWKVSHGDLSGSDTVTFKVNAVIGTTLLVIFTLLTAIPPFLFWVIKTNRTYIPMTSGRAVLLMFGAALCGSTLWELIPWTAATMNGHASRTPSGLQGIIIIGFVLVYNAIKFCGFIIAALSRGAGGGRT